MILFHEFKLSDWWEIEDAIEPFAADKPIKELTRGVSMTAREDGKVMACGGIIFENDTEGTVWCKVSKKCLVKSFSWARTIKEAFSLMIKVSGDMDIKTYILEGFCKGDKLARLIGLKKSSESEIFNGNTYYKYTAVA